MNDNWQGAFVYLDDIVMLESTPDNHKIYVQPVLTSLNHAGATLKLRKCKSFTSGIDHLGHVIRLRCVEVLIRSIHAIFGSDYPTTVGTMMSFRAVERFSSLCSESRPCCPPAE